MLTSLLTVLYLVLLEGLLSFDNSLALAALVKGRLEDPKQQRQALLWGIGGAYLFRLSTIFCGIWLMEHLWVKLVAGGYLIWMAIKELFLKGQEDSAAPKGVLVSWLSPLWATIVAVEIMDIMFSIDSIGVSLAVSNTYWILATGAAIGILMMRIAASLFVKLIARFPILEKTAFVLVALSGVNIILKGLGHPIPDVPFFLGILTLFVGSLFYPTC